MGRPDTTLSADELLRHDRWLRRMAPALISDPWRAEDAVQDTWLTALESPPRRGQNVRGWLTTVVRNKGRESARAEANRASREASCARPEHSPSESDLVERVALKHAISDAVLALPEHYRTTVILRFFEGLPPREIALRTAAPVDTVRTRLERALARLRATLDRHYGSRSTWAVGVAPLALDGDGGVRPTALAQVGRRLTVPSLAWAAAALIVVSAATVLLRAAVVESGERVAVVQPASVAAHRVPLPSNHGTDSGIARRALVVELAPSPAAPYSAARSLGMGAFDVFSDGPRAIALAADGHVFAYEYGEHGRALALDSNGSLRGFSEPIGYCSEAVCADGFAYLTQPAGRLVKLDQATLTVLGAAAVPDSRGGWLVNALCAWQDRIFTVSGEDGVLHAFDPDLELVRSTRLFPPNSTWIMDAGEHHLFAVVHTVGGAYVQPVRLRGSAAPVCVGTRHALPDSATDIAVVGAGMSLVALERGELLQLEYAGNSGDGESAWTVRARVDLSGESWFRETKNIARITYDAEREVLYLSCRGARGRVVSLPYSVAAGRRR